MIPTCSLLAHPSNYKEVICEVYVSKNHCSVLFSSLKSLFLQIVAFPAAAQCFSHFWYKA